ncbi:MAG: hypothetical protein ABIG84_02640 [archaeon]
MSVFRCCECGNTIEEEAPPEKCACGAKFSYDEVFDYDDDDDDDESEVEPEKEEEEIV